MGRATRWLKGLVGMKKEKENAENSNLTANNADKKEKKRWSFAKSGKDNSCEEPSKPFSFPVNTENTSVTDTAWLGSYISESDREQNKQAIAVASATAAAADAAVAAAQAAVAVVRLTSQGNKVCWFGSGKESAAAVKIQTVFRGYLARKALRALKGLVKLQALVRGYLVRKRAAATLHSMQALIRAQINVRYQRARRSFNKDHGSLPEIRPRESIERFAGTKSEFHQNKRISTSYEFDESPKTVEIDTYKPRSSRSRRFHPPMSECGEDIPYYQTISSPLPCCPDTARTYSPNSRHMQDFNWCLTGDECKFSSAQITPRFGDYVWSNKSSIIKPAKSVNVDKFFRDYTNSPNYMADTQSFKAKLRSHSAPRQRPEPGSKRRVSLSEIMAARNSISSVRSQKTSCRVEEAAFEF